MDELVVEVHNVVKRFGSCVRAVDGLNLAVRAGQTYGLLGPNGAGKTTVMRMVLGLARPSSGDIRVLGRPPGDPVVLRQVGAMGEVAFYPFLSGRDNLRAAARRCRVSDRRVDELLELVSLTARGGDAFSGYSLGMKQRLGVAAALLKDPKLLVLDEPSNGLDPVGRLDMRALIRQLGGSGRTILLSSHDLAEVERLCDRVGVICGGRMVAEGSPDELRGGLRLRVRAEPAERAAAVARGLPGVSSAALVGGGVVEVALGGFEPAGLAAVNRELVGAGVQVSELRARRRPLQDVFLELTGRRTAGAGSVPPGDEGRPSRRRSGA